MTQDDRVLIGRRRNHPLPLSWQLPGGWLHYAESPEQAVQRLQQQFIGLQCDDGKLVAYSNNLFDDGLHSISLYFQVKCHNGLVLDLHQNNDCSDWMWADWYHLPEPLFLPLQKLKETGFTPFVCE